MRPLRRARLLALLLVLGSLLTCLGAHATAAGQSAVPDWSERLGRAARNAALAPRTWVPLLGAVALQAGEADRRLQSWAAEQTPLFGSRRNADRISDDLKLLANSAWVISAVVPWQDEDAGLMGSKARVLGVQVVGHMATSGLVARLKDDTARLRPNGEGATSFPSDHASRAALHTAYTRFNITHLGWSDVAQARASVGLDVLSAGTAWARIEAHQHYPSDVLAGMALGNFIGTFVTQAFLNRREAQGLQVMLQPTRDRFLLTLQMPF